MTGFIEHPLSLESLDQMTTKHEITCQEISEWSLCCSLKLLSSLFSSLHSPVHQHPEEESVVKIIRLFNFYVEVMDVSVDNYPVFCFCKV